MARKTMASVQTELAVVQAALIAAHEWIRCEGDRDEDMHDFYGALARQGDTIVMVRGLARSLGGVCRVVTNGIMGPMPESLDDYLARLDQAGTIGAGDLADRIRQARAQAQADAEARISRQRRAGTL